MIDRELICRQKCFLRMVSYPIRMLVAYMFDKMLLFVGRTSTCCYDVEPVLWRVRKRSLGHTQRMSHHAISL